MGGNGRCQGVHSPQACAVQGPGQVPAAGGRLQGAGADGEWRALAAQHPRPRVGSPGCQDPWPQGQPCPALASALGLSHLPPLFPIQTAPSLLSAQSHLPLGFPWISFSLLFSASFLQPFFFSGFLPAQPPGPSHLRIPRGPSLGACLSLGLHLQHVPLCRCDPLALGPYLSLIMPASPCLCLCLPLSVSVCPNKHLSLPLSSWSGWFPSVLFEFVPLSLLGSLVLSVAASVLSTAPSFPGFFSVALTPAPSSFRAPWREFSHRQQHP